MDVTAQMNETLRVIGQMLERNDEILKSGEFNGEKLSKEELDKLEKAGNEAKQKREELFKMINNAS